MFDVKLRNTDYLFDPLICLIIFGLDLPFCCACDDRTFIGKD